MTTFYQFKAFKLPTSGKCHQPTEGAALYKFHPQIRDFSWIFCRQFGPYPVLISLVNHVLSFSEDCVAYASSTHVTKIFFTSVVVICSDKDTRAFSSSSQSVTVLEAVADTFIFSRFYFILHQVLTVPSITLLP